MKYVSKILFDSNDTKKSKGKKRMKKTEGTSAFIEASNGAYTNEMCHY